MNPRLIVVKRVLRLLRKGNLQAKNDRGFMIKWLQISVKILSPEISNSTNKKVKKKKILLMYKLLRKIGKLIKSIE